jgi:DNA-binding MarR family transcriptional regulator
MAKRDAAGGERRISSSHRGEPDYQNLARFRFAIRQFLSHSDSISRTAGITSQQYQTMLAIRARENAEVGIKELAEDMLLLPHGAVQIVNRLETIDLVQRRKSENDGRKVLVSLTSRGKRMVKRLAAAHEVELRRHEPLLVESLGHLRVIPD